MAVQLLDMLHSCPLQESFYAMTSPALIVGLGEILWDVLPSGTVLGGAPANFAYMTRALGDDAVIASRIGKDERGDKMRAALRERRLNTEYLQIDEELETGMTRVTLEKDGQPTFSILQPAAWDQLAWTSQWEALAAHADVVCFGSLAQRSPISSETIRRFLLKTRPSTLRICDVNLRAPFYNAEVLHRSFDCAHLVKLNEHELGVIGGLFQLKGCDHVSLARELLSRFDLRLVCITRGATGSLLVTSDEAVEHSGIPVRVVDAVGAGDAFTACLVHHYMRGSSLSEMSEAANRLAAWVVTQSGATPPLDEFGLKSMVANS